jgi:hypothetical protein
MLFARRHKDRVARIEREFRAIGVRGASSRKNKYAFLDVGVPVGTAFGLAPLWGRDFDQS